MRKSFLMRFLVVALLSSAVWAQGIQNNDIFFSAGPAWNKSRVIGGTNVTLADSWGASNQIDYGYQFARASAASLLVDLSIVFAYPGALKANVPASGSTSFSPITLGLRFMVPVHSRLSFYAVSGVGFGSFPSPAVIGGANPLVSTHSTTHGVFAFGGGADIRLSRWLSVRAEVRDFVTGKDLGGAAGRHHVLPFFGVALHF
jgi:opacity protein-like surface antigen